MFRTSPLEELEERLSGLRAAVDEKHRLEARLREAEALRARLEAEVEAAQEQVTREARDVERFEAGGLIPQIYELLNLAESKLAKERRELVAASLRLESARQELEMLHEDRAAIEARLAELADVGEAYKKALAEKQKWLATAGDAGATRRVATALERAERTGRAREWLREIDEAIYFGHRAEAALGDLAAKLAGTMIEKPVEKDGQVGPTRLPLAVLRREQEELILLTGSARHRLVLFHSELRDVHDRLDELARTLYPKDPWQLLDAFDDYDGNWMERSLQLVTVERSVWIRARIGAQLGLLQTLRNELASPHAVAGDVLRVLDRVHGE